MPETCFMDDERSWTARYQTLAVMPNHFPITPLAILMFPTTHRSDLQPGDLASALDFAERFPEYLIFHNMAGSGASRPDHVHLQGVVRDDLYPIERAPRTHLFTIGETKISRLDGYPVYGLTVTGPRVVVVDTVFSLRAELQADDPRRPFNLVLSGGEAIFIPRSAERPAGFSGAFAGLEIAGGIVLTDEAQYNSLTAGEVNRALSECGQGPWERVAFEDRLRRRFAQ